MPRPTNTAALASFVTVSGAQKRTQVGHRLDERGEIGANDRMQVGSPKRKNQALIIKVLRTLASDFKAALHDEMVKRSGDIRSAMENGGIFGTLLEELPFEIDVSRAITYFKISASPSELNKIAATIRKGGRRLHRNQVRTLVATMIETALHVAKPGIIIGPMQSGKTGIALGVAIFLAPLMYRLTGVKFFPQFASTNQIAHKNQTDQEMNALLDIYGSVEIKVSKGSITPSEYYTMVDFFRLSLERPGLNVDTTLNEDFLDTPTPKEYRNSVMRNDKLHHPDQEVQIVFNRTGGFQIKNARLRMNIMAAQGFSLLLLIDEPQHGASGTLTPTGRKVGVKGIKGEVNELRGNVLRQIMADIETDILEADGAHMAIGFSATPFDVAYMEGFWNVRSYLSPNYVGYNCWGGAKIDESVWFRTPLVHGFDELASATKTPDISKFREHLGIVNPRKSRRKTKNKTTVEPIDYSKARRAFKRLIAHLKANRPRIAAEILTQCPDLKDELDARLALDPGICLRVRDNTRAENICDGLKLEEDFQVFRYWGNTYTNEAAGGRKEAMTPGDILERYWDRNDPRPPLFVVTGRARMADQFAREIELYIDFARDASDQNAVLQGFVGRSCGEGKYFSQVVLGEGPLNTVRKYVQTMGLPEHNPSRHALGVGGRIKRGRGAKIMRVGLLGAAAEDPVIKRFIQDVNDTIVKQRFDSGPVKGLITHKATFYPLPAIMAKPCTGPDGTTYADLFAYLSDPEVQARLYPDMEPMEIVNPFKGEKISHVKRGSTTPIKLGYDIQKCRTLRAKGRDLDGKFGPSDDLMNVSFRHRPLSEINQGHYSVANREDRRESPEDLNKETKGARRTDRATNFGGTHPSLEVQINCYLRDPATQPYSRVEAAITKRGGQSPGIPEAYMVTFPLKAEAKRRVQIEGSPSALPRVGHWAEKGMNSDERALRDGVYVERARRAADRKAKVKAKAV